MELFLTEEYPMQAPKVRFLTKIYHPNIDKLGRICLDILKDQWTPALQIRTVLLSIQALLSSPNPKDPLANDVAQQWLSNIAEAEATGTHTFSYLHFPPYLPQKTNAPPSDSVFYELAGFNLRPYLPFHSASSPLPSLKICLPRHNSSNTNSQLAIGPPDMPSNFPYLPPHHRELVPQCSDFVLLNAKLKRIYLYGGSPTRVGSRSPGRLGGLLFHFQSESLVASSSPSLLFKALDLVAKPFKPISRLRPSTKPTMDNS